MGGGAVEPHDIFQTKITLTCLKKVQICEFYVMQDKKDIWRPKKEGILEKETLLSLLESFLFDLK